MNLVSFDTETHLIQPGLAVPPLVCGSSAWLTSDGQIDHPRLPYNKQETLDYFVSLLSTDCILVGANIAYDILVCANELIRQGIDIMPRIFKLYDDERVYDVLIATQLHAIGEGWLDTLPDGGTLRGSNGKPSKRYSLDSCVQIYLDRDDAKERDFWRLRYAMLEDTPVGQWPEDARRYPIDDVVNTLEVALAQIKREVPNLHQVPAQTYASFALALGGAWGFAIDGEYLDRLDDKITESRAEGIKRFQALGFVNSEGKASKATIGARVAQAYGEATPKTPKGQISQDRDTLAESGDEDLIAYAQFGADAKIQTTYIPFFRDAAGKPLTLRPNVLVETGRTSYDGVIQQIPRKGGVRECIVARPGYLLCSCDFTGAELATHAQSCLWLFGKSKLADIINAGGKPHNMLAAQLAGISYDEYNTRYEKDSFLKALRQAAKAANFGFPGGMGELKFTLSKRKEDAVTKGKTREYAGLRFCILMSGAEECGNTLTTEYKKGQYNPPVCLACVQQAKKLRQAWIETFPENREYFTYMTERMQETNTIVQHVSNRVRAGVTFTSACNTYFQGLTSDGFKHAMTRASKEAYTDRSSALYGTRLILAAHDELIAEVPEAIAHDAAMRLSAVMIESMRVFVPDVKIEAEPALMTRWYKGAEPKYDENGRLIPWR